MNRKKKRENRTEKLTLKWFEKKETKKYEV